MNAIGIIPLNLTSEYCTALPPLFFSLLLLFNDNDNESACLWVKVDRVWKECRTTVEMGLVYAGDWMKHFEGHVAGLLEGGKVG